jgi:hypothetical protein
MALAFCGFTAQESKHNIYAASQKVDTQQTYFMLIK